MWVGGVWVQLLGCQGTCAGVILVLRGYIRNALAVSLVLPTFDETGSLGSPMRQVVYPPSSMVSTWVTASPFFPGNS